MLAGPLLLSPSLRKPLFAAFARFRLAAVTVPLAASVKMLRVTDGDPAR